MIKEAPLRRSPLERHFQTFVGMAVLGIGAWLISTTQQQTVAVAVQSERIHALTLRIDGLTNLSMNQYTAEDAMRDFAMRDAELARISERIRILEGGAR